MSNSNYLVNLEKIFKENQAHLERSAKRFGIGPQNIEDCIQDLFLKILEKQIDLSEFDNPKSWLTKVLSRHCISFLRKKELTTSYDFDTLIDTSDDDFDIEPTLRLLERILKDYKKEPKSSIAKLYYFEKLTFPEISKKLKIPLNTVLSHHRRFKIQIKHALSQCLLAEE
ncbi:MAG: sigma-70 family RNA polymerase sigma factor [Pseudobacteriovorax sp.]|nr:sigma-70 family RNA polymerase sigma factor [Pseudobacteriovorax sp.]